MSSQNGRTAEVVKQQIHSERELLADSVDQLRAGLQEATDVAGKLRTRLPLVAAGAAGAGFFVAGGIGATARLLFRRGRER